MKMKYSNSEETKEIPTVKTSSSEEYNPEIIEKATFYLKRIDGFIQNIKKELESLPKTDVPVGVKSETVDLRVAGKKSYLFIMKKNPVANVDVEYIDAIGLDELNRILAPKLEIYTGREPIILESQINKRTPRKQYLVILVS